MWGSAGWRQGGCEAKHARNNTRRGHQGEEAPSGGARRHQHSGVTETAIRSDIWKMLAAGSDHWEGGAVPVVTALL